MTLARSFALAASAAALLAACSESETTAESMSEPAQEALDLTVTSAVTQEEAGGIASVQMLNNSDNGYSGVAVVAPRTGGLTVYDIDGFVLSRITEGRYSALAASPDFQLRGAALPLMAALDIEQTDIALFAFARDDNAFIQAPVGELEGLSAPRAICGGDSNISRLEFFAINDNRQIERWRVRDTGAESLQAERVENFNAPFDARGCAYDPESDSLYLTSPVGELARLGPDRGVEQIRALRSDGVDVGVFAGGRRVMASSGDRLLLIDPSSLETLESLSFGPGLTIPGLQAPGALDVSARSYGGAYPDGVIAVADGQDGLLKFIDMGYLERALSEPENRFAPMPPRES